MNLIAMILLAPALGWFVADRRRVHAALVAVWFLILPFQTNEVLLGEQSDEPLANTLGYFGMNYVILGLGLVLATFIHRRRHAATGLPAVAADMR